MWRGLALADLSAIRYIVIRWGILEFARRLDDRTRAATILWEVGPLPMLNLSLALLNGETLAPTLDPYLEGPAPQGG